MSKRTCIHGVTYEEPRDLLADCHKCRAFVDYAMPYIKNYAQNLCDKLNNKLAAASAADAQVFKRAKRPAISTLPSSVHGGRAGVGGPEHEMLMQHLFAGRLARKLTPSLDILDYIIDTNSESLFRAIESACRRTIRAVYGRDLIIQSRPFAKR